MCSASPPPPLPLPPFIHHLTVWNFYNNQAYHRPSEASGASRYHERPTNGILKPLQHHGSNVSRVFRGALKLVHRGGPWSADDKTSSLVPLSNRFPYTYVHVCIRIYMYMYIMYINIYTAICGYLVRPILPHRWL